MSKVLISGGEYLKKKTIISIVSICLLLIVIISFIAYLDATDPLSEMYKDRIEYPLKSVDVNDTSNYMLVKWEHSPIEKYEVITDTQAIKANVSTFSVSNKGDIYGTTPDGCICVNGKVKCTIFGKVMSEFSASKVQNSRQVKCRTFGNRSKALSTI